MVLHVDVKTVETPQIKSAIGTLVPVILCGGAGSRLWPLSREHHPKPFIKLADGESLLQKAFLRAKKIAGVQHIVTITNRELFFKVEDAFSGYKSLGLHQSFILEPFARNTAPAIMMAALYVQQMHGDDASILILPADHLIEEQNAFEAAATKAKAYAHLGKLVTFGMKPMYPESGFGYIEADAENVLRFVEKPSRDIAQEYINRGNFFWNSGMFCFPVGEFLKQMAIHAEEMFQMSVACFKESRVANSDCFSQVELPVSFANIPDNSIDYALMEPMSASPAHRHQLSVVPCELGWSDIGSWNALSELIAADASNNRILGDVYLKDTQNTYVQSEGRVVGLVGVDDLIVVDTPDALLVAHKNHAQSVKSIYTHLKENAHEAFKLHRTVHRPWGTYTVLEKGEGFKIKKIEVKPGASLSLQMHYHRSEHWIVVSGMANVVNGEQTFLIQTNESTYIPAGHKHRLTNPGKIPLVMIEVQSGDYLGEDDIVRFDDIYGRV